MGKNKGKRSHTKHVFVQKKYRDALFRRIFNEKPVLLELYNALNQTDYDDADELIFYTIDDVIYLGYKNDVSFIVRGTLNLYEHQSTLNPNMPIRGRAICVMVSPTFTSLEVLIPEIIYPTSPVRSSLRGTISIFNTPISSASYSFPVLKNFTLSPLRIVPFSILK